MPANAALYLPVDAVDLADIFPESKRTGGFLWRNTSFDVPSERGTVRFNVMPKKEMSSHLAQFGAYIASLDDDAEAKQAAREAVEATGVILGLETQLDFDGSGDVSRLLERVVIHYQGCIFMFDSLVRHDGEILVGPLKSSAT